MQLRDRFLRLRINFEQYKRKLLDEIGSMTYIVQQERTQEGVDGRVVVYSDPKSHVAEQYRILRTNLRSLSPDKSLRSFVVTSALRGEGKSVTTANTSVAFSLEPETKVLLIDTDLRKPAVHKIFGLSREPGLSDILVDDYDPEHFLQEPVVGNLCIIPAGKQCPNPAEVLSSRKMKEFIATMRGRFDYLFCDGAPIIPVTDAGVVGAHVDGAILVVRSASTGALDVERAFSLLKEANANPIGAVLTNVVTYIPYYLYRYRYIYVNKYGV